MQQDYQEAEAWVLHAEGEDDKAAGILRTLADKNDKLGDEPGWIPAREMLADLLLEAKHPQQALAEYQTDLKLNPNRFNALYGAARAAEAGRQTERRERVLRAVAEELRRGKFDAAGVEPCEGVAGEEVIVTRFGVLAFER